MPGVCKMGPVLGPWGYGNQGTSKKQRRGITDRQERVHNSRIAGTDRQSCAGEPGMHRADEPFPGAQERVVLITGSLECVSQCLSLVIEQVHKHFTDYPYADKEAQLLDPNAHRTMNLVVPTGASGRAAGR